MHSLKRLVAINSAVYISSVSSYQLYVVENLESDRELQKPIVAIYDIAKTFIESFKRGEFEISLCLNISIDGNCTSHRYCLRMIDSSISLPRLL